MAGWAYRLRQVDDGIPVAVHVDVQHFDVVAGGLALAPAPFPRAAVKGCKPKRRGTYRLRDLSSWRLVERNADPYTEKCCTVNRAHPVCRVSLMAFRSANACMRTSPVSTCCAMATTSPLLSHFRLSRKGVIWSTSASGLATGALLQTGSAALWILYDCIA